MASRGSTVMAMPGHRRRDIKGRIPVEEANRLQAEADVGDRHDGPFLGAWNVVHPDRIPDDQIGVFYGTIHLRPLWQSGAPRMLVRIVASCIFLGGVIRRDPQMLCDERGSLRDAGVLVGKRKDVFSWNEFVGDRLTQAVQHCWVDDL